MMSLNARRVSPAFAAFLLFFALTLSACTSQPRVTYEVQVTSYAVGDLEGFARDLEKPSVFGDPVDDATRMRQDALADLRSKGGSAPDLADMLTGLFPSETLSVPFYAAEAEVDGKDAWLVAEVWGSEGGTFDRIRLWAFDRETADVLYSTSFK